VIKTGMAMAATGAAGMIAIGGSMPAEAFTTSEATTRLRAAAAIENAATIVCRTTRKASLLSVGAGGRALDAVLARLLSHHGLQAKLLNDASTALGGEAQMNADDAVQRQFSSQVSHATSLADILHTLADLENVAAASCAAYTDQVGDPGAIKALMVIGPIHAQDAAVLKELAEVASASEDSLARSPEVAKLGPKLGAAGSGAALLDLRTARPVTKGR
jgi:hypothetical protein